MVRIEGKVEGVNSSRSDMIGVIIAGTWYNTRDTTIKPKAGDIVAFDSEDVQKGDRTFHNIVGKIEIKIATTHKEAPLGSPNQNRDAVIRELAVKKISAVVYKKGEFEGCTFAEVCKAVNETQL